ncbi:MAG: tetratricopeptide repeat protein [Sedimentisphaerales bacterium]|nr:tetratricopeptide repeat protein [Sedimentisphaerales bacterium]
MKTIVKSSIRLGFVVSLAFLAGCTMPWDHRRAVESYVNALTFESQAQDEQAIAELQEAVRLDHNFALAHSLLGDIYRENGQYEEAASAYESACELDPWAFGDHFHLGQVYQALKRFVDAIRPLTRAVQLQPEHPQANFSLAVCYYETGDYQQAQLYGRRAADLDPANADFLAVLGNIYDKTEDDYQAINTYKQALEFDDDNIDVMLRLGAVYSRMKRYDPAQLILEKAVATDPAAAGPHLALAYCLIGKRDLPSAQSHYQTTLSIDPENYQAYNGLGVTAMMQYIEDRSQNELAEKALENWHRSLEINPDQPKIQNLIARYTAQIHGMTPEQSSP